MTEDIVKEFLSRNFVNIIANYNKCICTKPEYDEGVDLNVTYSTEIRTGNKIRHLSSGQYLDIQLKSTTENGIIDEIDTIKYDLEVKNYNDLIKRRDGYNKLLLILYILPTDINSWIEVNDNELILRKNAYWFFPNKSLINSNNSSTIRIEIPKINRLDRDFFNNKFKEFYSN